MTNKRRITHDVTKPVGGNHLVPVQLQGVGVDNGAAGVQRDAGEVGTKFLRDLQVYLVVHQPQCDLGNLGGKFFNFDAVKLVHIDQNQAGYVEGELVAGAGGA